MADTTNISSSPLVATGTASQPTTRRRIRRRKVNAGRERKQAQQYYAGQQTQHRHDTAASRKTPGAPPDPYKAQLDALVGEKYGTATSAAQRQQAAVPSAFDAYRAIISGIAGRQQAAYAAGVNQLGQFGGQLANGAAQVVSAARGQQQAGAQVTGGTPDQAVLDDAAKAAAVRQGMVGNLGGLVTAQGLAENAYLGNRQASSGPLQLQAQTNANQALTDLEREKGAYRVNARNDLQAAAAAAAEQTYKDQLAAQIAGVNATDKLADNRRATTQIRVTRRQKTADRRSRERQNAQDNATSVANTQARVQAQAEKDRRQTRIKNRTTSRKVEARFDDINGQWKLLRKSGKHIEAGPDTTTAGINLPVVKGPSHDDLVGQLVNAGFSTTEIRLARLLHQKKTFTAADMRHAKALGYIVPKHLRPKGGG